MSLLETVLPGLVVGACFFVAAKSMQGIDYVAEHYSPLGKRRCRLSPDQNCLAMRDRNFKRVQKREEIIQSFMDEEKSRKQVDNGQH